MDDRRKKYKKKKQQKECVQFKATKGVQYLAGFLKKKKSYQSALLGPRSLVVE